MTPEPDQSVLDQFVYCKAKVNLRGASGFGIRAASQRLRDLDPQAWSRLESLCDLPRSDCEGPWFGRHLVGAHDVVVRKVLEAGHHDRRQFVHGVVAEAGRLDFQDWMAALDGIPWMESEPGLPSEGFELPALAIPRVVGKRARPDGRTVVQAFTLSDSLGPNPTQPIVVAHTNPVGVLHLAAELLPRKVTRAWTFSTGDVPAQKRSVLTFAAHPAERRAKDSPRLLDLRTNAAGAGGAWISELDAMLADGSALGGREVLDLLAPNSLDALRRAVESAAGLRPPPERERMRQSIMACPPLIRLVLRHQRPFDLLVDLFGTDATFWDETGFDVLERAITAEDLTTTHRLQGATQLLRAADAAARAGNPEALITMVNGLRIVHPNLERAQKQVIELASKWPRTMEIRSQVVEVLTGYDAEARVLDPWLTVPWAELNGFLSEIVAELRTQAIVLSIRDGEPCREPAVADLGADLDGAVRELAANQRNWPALRAFLREVFRGGIDDTVIRWLRLLGLPNGFVVRFLHADAEGWPGAPDAVGKISRANVAWLVEQVIGDDSLVGHVTLQHIESAEPPQAPVPTVPPPRAPAHAPTWPTPDNRRRWRRKD